MLCLFDIERQRLQLAERAARPGRHQHGYGGVTPYDGLIPGPRRPPVQLLFRLDLRDPVLPLDPTSRIRFLPLLCAIRYGACEVGYRVVSDRRVEILHMAEQRPWKDFPRPDFADEVPPGPLRLARVPYRRSVPRDVVIFGGAFGLDRLTRRQHAAAWEYARSEFPQLAAEAEEEGLDLPTFTFTQGAPEGSCPRRQCRDHGRPASMRVLGTFSAEDREQREQLWGDPHLDLQIIYEFCPRCRAMRVTNQAT